MRCLVPLSTDAIRLNNDASTIDVVEPRYPSLTPLAPSPPLACVLEEKPFAVGGLADRIVPELLTGVGYGFEKGTDQVQPIDTGKETSRDGRLDPRSWKYDQIGKNFDPSHFFGLEAEGPIGLHFERPTVPAPSWVNCQYMVKPRTIDGKYLPEESFLGMRLRRIFEPDWVVALDPASIDPRKLSLVHAWQASLKDWTGPGASPLDLLVAENSDGTTVPVLKCVIENTATYSYLVFYFNRQLLGKGYTAKDVVVCAVPFSPLPLPLPSPPPKLSELRLQHLCQGDGRYILNILATLKAQDLSTAIARGSSNFPLLLASVEWKATEDLKVTTDQHLKCCEGVAVATLTASPGTVREWGRTAKNADWIHCIATGACKPFPVATLIATKRFTTAGDSLVFANSENPSLWPISSNGDSRQPLSVQRHLIGVFTKRSGGAGKQFDLFLGTTMLNGRNPVISSTSEGRQKFQLATKIQLHELEVPSAIVARLPVQPKEFEWARLDLIATGGTSTSSVARRYRLHLRFANSAIGLAGAATIKIVLAAFNTNNNKSDLAEVPCENQVRAVDIFLQNGAPLQYRYHTTSGIVKDLATLSTPATLNGLLDAESIGVSLQAPGFGEVWADVSLLHSLPTAGSPLDPNNFDFDWLFSNHDDEPSVDDRLSARALGTLAEAQARFISMSPLIDLTGG